MYNVYFHSGCIHCMQGIGSNSEIGVNYGVSVQVANTQYDFVNCIVNSG